MSGRGFKEEIWEYYAFREFVEKPLRNKRDRSPSEER